MPSDTIDLTMWMSPAAIVGLSDTDPAPSVPGAGPTTIDFTEVTNPPIYRTAQTPAGGPALSLNGANQVLTSGTILGSDLVTANTSTLFAVYKCTNTASTLLYWASPPDSNDYSLYTNVGGQLYHDQGDTGGGGREFVTAPDGNWHILVAIRDVARGLIRVDGVTIFDNASAFSDDLDVTASGGINLFSYQQAADFFAGLVGDLGVYSTVKDYAALEADLSASSGIALPATSKFPWWQYLAQQVVNV